MTTTNKGLIQPTNGSYVDTWDQPVNNDWSYIDTAFGGAVSLNATGISTHTLTLTEYRPLFLIVGGAISNNVTYSIPSGVGGQWIIFNGTTDATGGPWSIIFTCVGSAVTVTIPRGTTTNVACDGTNLLFADGRPGSPGGSNTQVQYNNNGTLGGSSNFVFDGTNVGIGTTTLNFKLTAANNAFDGVWMGSSGTYSFVGLGGYSSSSAGSAQIGFERSTGAFVFGNGTRDTPTERMRIAATGNVGIGTTSPAALLDINGNTNVRGTLFLGSTVVQNIAADSTTLYLRGNAVSFQNAAATTTQLYINSSGNVGIGTTSPSQNLTVVGNIEATNIVIADNQIQFGSNSNIWYQAGGNQATLRAGASGNYGYFNFVSNATIPLIGGSTLTFSGNGGTNEHMRITTNGLVGIGTNNPGQRLTVAGNDTNITTQIINYNNGATTNKASGLQFFGADTVSAVKEIGAIYFTPADQNFVGSNMVIYVRQSDATNARFVLNGDGRLTTYNVIQSASGGFQFPDNTVQTTAATTTPPATGTGGLYTYALLQYLGGAIAAGTNVTSNGSNLVYVDAAGVGSQYIPAGQIWQAMGYGNAPTLFQRTT